MSNQNLSSLLPGGQKCDKPQNSLKIGLDMREIGSKLAFKIRALDDFRNLMNSLASR